MKKSLFIMLLSCTVVFVAAAQENQSSVVQDSHVLEIPEEVRSNTTYQTVPIFKIYDQPNSFMILYQTASWDIGKVAFSKEWFHSYDARGTVRQLPASFGSYLTIYYTDGKFSRVVISAPADRKHKVWGIMYPDPNLDKYMADESYTLKY